MALRISRYLLRRAHRHDLPTATAAFRPEINDPVCRLDYVQIVFNNHNGIAPILQFVQDFQQLFDVVEMQASGRLVQDIQGLAGIALGQFAGQLHPLRRAAGRVGGAMPAPPVIRPNG